VNAPASQDSAITFDAQRSDSGIDFRVIPIATAEEQDLFLDVPTVVYANDPNWVPPIRSSVAKKFAPTNPFFQYGKLQQFLAVRVEDGAKTTRQSQPVPQVLGRIVAAVNQRLIEREENAIGLFGFFECVEDFAIAQALLDRKSVV